MIKNIVFDMGKVLIRYDAYDYTNKYVSEKEYVSVLCEEVFQSIEWIQMDRGILEEEDAIRSIQRRLPEKLQQYVPMLIENWHMEIPPYPEMKQLAKELQENGYHLYLLSNTSKRFHQFCIKIPALQYFEGTFISADYRMLKPEPVIFHTFYQHFQLNPAECFFIDDNNANIEAAKMTGMSGFIYRGNVEKCKIAMRKEGIQI